MINRRVNRYNAGAGLMEKNIKAKPHAVKGQWNVKQKKGSCVDGLWPFGLIITQRRGLLAQWPLSVRCSHRAEFKYWVAPLCGPQLRLQRFQTGCSRSTKKTSTNR